MEAKDITKTELKKVAKEFNEQMGLEPPILLDLKVSALKEKCIEAAGQIDLEQDEYSDEVWEILGALGCDPREDAEEEADEAVEEDADEAVEEAMDADEAVEEDAAEEDAAEEDADEAVEEAMEDTLVEDFKGARKLAELKEVAAEWDIFANLDLDSYAGLQGPKKLRAAMLACMPDEVREQLEPKPEAKADKPAKPKKEKKENAVYTSMSRIEAAVKALSEKETSVAADLAQAADAAYVAAGGKSNEKESLWASRMVLNVIENGRKYGLCQ